MGKIEFDDSYLNLSGEEPDVYKILIEKVKRRIEDEQLREIMIGREINKSTKDK